MTSPLDIPATLLPLLGVTNPPQDYSLGYDLFGDVTRNFTIICDWNNVAYVDSQRKAIFPLKAIVFTNRQRVTSQDDEPVADAGTFFVAHRTQVVQIMKQLKLFAKGK